MSRGCWYIRFVLVCCGCGVHLDAGLGWGLLFSLVRHEARTLIRTHLPVREMLRSDYSSNLISFLPHFSCSTENRLLLAWQTDTTTRRWHWTTVSNLEDIAEFSEIWIMKGHVRNKTSHLCHLWLAPRWRRVKTERPGSSWFVRKVQRSENT